ncbi:hypothetical protein VTO42DRAFT_7326 [Malbranchea cinnamomea]
MARIQRVYSKGIYHGLPVFPEELGGLTAIVAGSNGISGHHMLRVLCESPKRWTKIYSISRRPSSGTWPKHVKHISMDFLQPPETLATQMKERGVRKVDYVFFFAYIQPQPEQGKGIWAAADKLVEVNTKLLRNFLEALELLEIFPKRILLQLGAKYYGMHLGPSAIPQEETDPRVKLEPNFYYPQEDYLREFCQRHGIGWNTTRPCWIPGAVTDGAMNLVYPLAIYATVQKHLGRPLEYPSDLAAWESNQAMSSAQMNCYLSEWAVLTDAAKDQSFNASDDCAFTFGKFWPKLAERFSMPYTRPVIDSSVYKEYETPYDPPPRGFGPPATIRFRFLLTDWAKTPEVQRAWEEIAEQHQLRHRKLRDIDRVFGFLDAALTSNITINFSTAKTKKLGFFGFVESTDSIFQVLQDFVDLKMIPPLPQSCHSEPLTQPIHESRQLASLPQPVSRQDRPRRLWGLFFPLRKRKI